MKRKVLGLLAAALLALAACSGGQASRPAGMDSAVAGPPPNPRAEYEAYQRDYAARRQALRLRDWQAVQQRAARQLEERRRQDAVRHAQVQRRWQGYP